MYMACLTGLSPTGSGGVVSHTTSDDACNPVAPEHLTYIIILNVGVGLSFTSMKFRICKLKEWLPFMDVKKQNAISDLVLTSSEQILETALVFGSST